MNNLLAQINITEEELRDAGVPISNTPDSSIAEVLQIVFALGGVIAVLVITIAGIQFMLSNGNPQKANGARNAIIYAGVGLALMVSAYAIVAFVVNRV